MKKLVFIHGGPGFKDYLEDFFAGQFQGGVETVFYDQISKKGETLQAFILQLDGIVKSIQQDIYLIGHSWGGVLMLEYLRRGVPSKIKGLVLIDSYLCADHANLEFERELTTLGLNRPTWEQIFLSRQELKEGSKFIDDLERSFEATALEELKDYLNSFDVRDTFQSVTVPILNIYGESDIRVPARVIKTFPDLNSKTKNVEIHGAGHFPFVLRANRDQIVKAIQKFIEN